MTSFAQCRQMLNTSIGTTNKAIARANAFYNEASLLNALKSVEVGTTSTALFADKMLGWVLDKSNQALVKAKGFHIESMKLRESFVQQLYGEGFLEHHTTYDDEHSLNHWNMGGVGGSLYYANNKFILEQEDREFIADNPYTHKDSKLAENLDRYRDYIPDDDLNVFGEHANDVEAQEKFARETMAKSAKGVLNPARIALATTAFLITISVLWPMLTYNLRTDLSVPSNVTAVGQTANALRT